MCRHRGASHSTRHGLLFAETRSSCICSRGRRRRCLFYSVESPCSLFRFPLCISIHHQTTCNTWLYIHGFRCCLTYIYKNLCGSHECPRWSLLHEGRKYQGRNSMENDAGKRNGQPTRTAASFFLPLYILLLQRWTGGWRRKKLRRPAVEKPIKEKVSASRQYLDWLGPCHCDSFPIRWSVVPLSHFPLITSYAFRSPVGLSCARYLHSAKRGG